VLDAGAVQMCGHNAGQAAPQARRDWGMAFVPEERLGRGAVPELGLTDNMLLTHLDANTVQNGMVQRHTLRQRAVAIIEQFNVKTSSVNALAKSLSGGNLQKFIVGRELSRAPKLLLIAQPTWGVDVGAAAVIHEAIVQLKAQGCAVLLVSEDLDELLKLSDRVQVIAKGKLSPSLDAAQATREQIGVWMSGLWDAKTL
jgi:general nucleoside transport system ATP-binding protein